jgi:hypothetical protein
MKFVKQQIDELTAKDPNFAKNFKNGSIKMIVLELYYFPETNTKETKIRHWSVVKEKDKYAATCSEEDMPEFSRYLVGVVFLARQKHLLGL